MSGGGTLFERSHSSEYNKTYQNRLMLTAKHWNDTNDSSKD